jgi:predicted nuclease with TOPRIM domain
VSKSKFLLIILTNVAFQDIPVGMDAAEEDISRLDANQLKTLTTALVRANRSLDKKKAQLRDMRETLADSKQQLEESCEESDDLKERLETMDVQMQQYWNWWLNEVQFTKVILSKVPNANQDWDLVRESQSHYLGRF